MNRPWVICHMCTSLDGKISGDFMETATAAPALRAYNELRGFYGCRATLYGTTTMLGGYANGLAQLDENFASVAREDYLAPAAQEAQQLIIALDPEGKLGYKSPIIEREGRAPAVVVEVLTEQVGNVYRAFLRKLGISYIIAGETELDHGLALSKLKEEFNIETLMLGGGGVLNWSFLQAGMCDEISIVLAAAADGSPDTPPVFRARKGLSENKALGFTLKEAKVMDGGAVWLRYTVNQ